MTAVVCECGHGKSDHVLLSRECRNPDPAAEDCVCTKFRPAKVAETDLHAVHRASSRGGDGLGYGPCVACGELWPCKTGRAIPVPAAGGIVKGSVIAYGFEPPVGTESTSAALARVTAERDELTAEVERLVDLGSKKMAELSDLASLAEGFRRTIAELTGERDSIREVMVFRTNELTKAVAERDEARSWLVARDDGLDCLRCGNSIYRGEAHEAMPASGGRQHVHCPHNQPPAEVIERREQWWCTTCGSRYRVNDLDHEHLPLKRVVTVTTAR